MNFVGVYCISNSFLHTHTHTHTHTRTHTHTEKTEYIDTKMLTLLYGHLWLVRLWTIFCCCYFSSFFSFGKHFSKFSLSKFTVIHLFCLYNIKIEIFFKEKDTKKSLTVKLHFIVWLLSGDISSFSFSSTAPQIMRSFQSSELGQHYHLCRHWLSPHQMLAVCWKYLAWGLKLVM